MSLCFKGPCCQKLLLTEKPFTGDLTFEVRWCTPLHPASEPNQEIRSIKRAPMCRLCIQSLLEVVGTGSLSIRGQGWAASQRTNPLNRSRLCCCLDGAVLLYHESSCWYVLFVFSFTMGCQILYSSLVQMPCKARMSQQFSGKPRGWKRPPSKISKPLPRWTRRRPSAEKELPRKMSK